MKRYHRRALVRVEKDDEQLTRRKRKKINARLCSRWSSDDNPVEYIIIQ